NVFKFNLCPFNQFYKLRGNGFTKLITCTCISGTLKSTDQDHAMASGSPYIKYTGNNQPTPCNPIYENYQNRSTEPSTAYQSSLDGGRTDGAHSSPDELYMQCDTNDPIYNNDPTFFHSHHENSEDLYIMPDT
ncbi:hypothetical protein NFI96_025004, partial [Prochilodus magdalenae]